MEKKSREEILKEMHEKLSGTEDPQYFNEVAMPGVYRPVNPEDHTPPSE